MFDLRVPKHRIFESNIPMPLSPRTCNHQDVYDRFHGGEQARNERVKFAQVVRIDWFMTRTEVREAIPPAYTEFIGKYLMQALEARGVTE